MTIREFLQGRRKAEYPVFMKVLDALPKDRFDYTPHERSPSAAQIVWTLALETKASSDLIDAGRVNWKPDPLPADPEIILSSFRNHSAELDPDPDGTELSFCRLKMKNVLDIERARPLTELNRQE
jgi:hypothetical protein